MSIEKDIALIEKHIEEKKTIDKHVEYEKNIAMCLVTKDFIKKHNLILYGGLALNMTLPKSKRFYDVYDLPDYDFFSYNAQQHAIQLADVYHKLGYKYIEVRPGIHEGTFKVSVNFVPVADITDIPQKLFRTMLSVSRRERSMLLKNNPDLDMNIAPLAFLRLSIHLELSRPNGHIERWPKVYSRMAEFYKNYPVNYTVGRPDKIFQQETIPRMVELSDIVCNFAKMHGLPIHGFEALKMYLQHHRGKVAESGHFILDKNMANIELISTNFEEDTRSLVSLLRTLLTKGEKVNAYEHPPLNKSEFVPRHFMIKYEYENVSRPLVVIYNSQACYSYKRMDGFCVLSIDAMLSFMYAYTFTHRDYYNIDKIKCAINILLNLQYQHRNSSDYVWKRFDLQCYGEQHTIEDIKRLHWKNDKTRFKGYRPS